MAILLTFDVLFFSYAMEIITFSGVSGMVLFASEFAILTSAMLGTFARYGVHIADLHRARGRADAPAWEAKSMYMFYIDLAAGEIEYMYRHLYQTSSSSSSTSSSSSSSSSTMACRCRSFETCT